MVFCCVPGCSSQAKPRKGKPYGDDVSFFSIPRKPFSRYKTFVHAIGGDDKLRPTKYSRVCSKHFINGRKIDLPESKSYTPTLALPNRSQQKRTHRRKKYLQGKVVSYHAVWLSKLEASKLDTRLILIDRPNPNRKHKAYQEASEPDSPALCTKSDDESISMSSCSQFCEETPILTYDTGTQYDISDILDSTHHSVVQNEHDHSFPLQCSEIASLELHCASLAEQLEKQTADFYSFQNLNALIAFHGFLKTKAEKLQYWRNSSKVTESQKYQTMNKGKPGRKRKMSTMEKLVMVLVRLKVGLFVVDISDRFDISSSQFSRIFTTRITFLSHELKLLFPFPTQAQIKEALPDEFMQFVTV
ncbi:uncharacterized protein LOC100368472 [Saccoglossus kowalevskii]